jgi:hypothetical protein
VTFLFEKREGWLGYGAQKKRKRRKRKRRSGLRFGVKTILK